MSPRLVQAVGRATALVVAFLAATTLGGGWWATAAVAAVGALSGRPGGLVHAAATLALVGGAAAQDAAWLVPLLVAGLFASVEGTALLEQVDRARPTASPRSALLTPVAAAIVAVAVLGLAALTTASTVPIALAATLAATALLTALGP